MFGRHEVGFSRSAVGLFWNRVIESSGGRVIEEQRIADDAKR
jgi:hypothetical protein